MGRTTNVARAARKVEDDTIAASGLRALDKFTPSGTAAPGQTRPLADIIGATRQIIPQTVEAISVGRMELVKESWQIRYEEWAKGEQQKQIAANQADSGAGRRVEMAM